MTDFTITVQGLQEVQNKFDALPTKIQEELQVAMTALGAEFIDYLDTTKLSGSPLHNVTGALQASFTAKTSTSSDDVSLTISSDSPYAAYHEFGFHGTESVRAFTRNGHPVRAFTRTVNYAGHPYFQPALDEYTPTIYADIDAAVQKALT